MKYVSVSGNTLPEAYHSAIASMRNYGEIVDCPDYNERQKEVSMNIHVREPLKEPRISRFLPGGAYDLQRYEMEMLDGILDFEVGRGNWEYTYHDRLAYQIPLIITELQRNPHSRRAIMTTRVAADIESASPPCMVSSQFFIRDGKLDQCVLFRSNDLLKAFFFNAWAMIRWQERIAAHLGVEVGTYSHQSNSMHVYERDWGLLEQYYKKIDKNLLTSLGYEYAGFFKELMEEEIPRINKFTEELKTH